MDRYDRLDALVRLLRDRPGATAAELAGHLGTSVRSVFRDVGLLRARGYPIESSRGRGGGLRLHPDWGLRRVLLSPEEALGVLLSLAVAEHLSLPMFASGLGRARRKVVDAFPSQQRRQLAPLRERVFVGPAASSAVARSYGAPRTNAVRTLQTAFVTQRAVRCVYRREDGDRSERRIEPHALLLNWPAWYLLAFDRLRDAVRTFRLDRFETVDVEESSFRPRPYQIIGSIEGLDREDPTTWRL